MTGKRLIKERFEDGFNKASNELKERNWNDTVKCDDLCCFTSSIEIGIFFNNPLFGLIGESTIMDE